MKTYYNRKISEFLGSDTSSVVGDIVRGGLENSTPEQHEAWSKQIEILRESLNGREGWISFEMTIPRMGKRIDVTLIVGSVVFVLEFKVGANDFKTAYINQVLDYALDLKNFHLPSHTVHMAPILVSTRAAKRNISVEYYPHNDGLIKPILTNADNLSGAISKVLEECKSGVTLNGVEFMRGSYLPTPTIIEAAQHLFREHSVKDITRSDASRENLTTTTSAVLERIEYAKKGNKKVICFVTGVPGAGKTLVGLNIAASNLPKDSGKSNCVYLSGNGPLVAVLQEALAEDRVNRAKEQGEKILKGEARTAVKSFIQIVHHFRDEYLRKPDDVPFEHVAIFDEAQRAWNRDKTIMFMKQKKGISDFNSSEPEFLISCMDRHKDWAVIICLVGEGQEIHDGEEGISGWINAIAEKFSNWEVVISPHLQDPEFSTGPALELLGKRGIVEEKTAMHLNVSLRSYRAESLTEFVHHLLLRDTDKAKMAYEGLEEKYPIKITRQVKTARKWLREQARGSERCGMVISSSAHRLKPLAMDVRAPVNPVHYFLKDRDDVRSSFYLEDAATEFQVQGLELDWVGLTWDADLIYSEDKWRTYSFVGTKWQNVRKGSRQRYLVNAYRVLLTRARQGMVIVVPAGNEKDPTRSPDLYNPTFDFLTSVGLQTLT